MIHYCHLVDTPTNAPLVSACPASLEAAFSNVSHEGLHEPEACNPQYNLLWNTE